MKKLIMTPRGRILVIEDDQIMREAVSEWVRAAGYEVAVALNARDGLDAAAILLPMLVVTDIHMPGNNGLNVIAEFKRLFPSLPLIAMSGLFGAGHGMDAADAMALGAEVALAKPFRRSELIHAIADLAGPSPA